MDTKLGTILLVDDDDATNFLHHKVIEKTGLVETIVTKQTGLMAIEYLKSMVNGKHPRPDLILLDINMPVMNGWEFLEAYKQLDISQQGKVIVVMLTTSINPDDKSKSKTLGMVNDFQNKPLTEEMFVSIVKQYFPERFFENEPI